jgi:hypothetical protein
MFKFTATDDEKLGEVTDTENNKLKDITFLNRTGTTNFEAPEGTTQFAVYDYKGNKTDVLPEEMITDLFWLGCASYPDVTWADTYPDEPFFSDFHSINYGYQLDSLYGQWVCSKTVQQLTYNLEGLTVESYYLVGSNASNSFANDDSYGIRANIPLPEYGDYSYMISKDDLKYRIDLRINNETLVFYKETATWYLQMPIKKITLTNLQTGNQVAAEFKDDVRIFMNTYSKIE